MDEDQIEVRVDELENLPITGRFGLRFKNIADGTDDKALASCTIKEGEKFFTKGPSAKRKYFDDQNVRFRILKRVA